jgi:hypothetical protein
LPIKYTNSPLNLLCFSTLNSIITTYSFINKHFLQRVKQTLFTERKNALHCRWSTSTRRVEKQKQQSLRYKWNTVKEKNSTQLLNQETEDHAGLTLKKQVVYLTDQQKTFIRELFIPYMRQNCENSLLLLRRRFVHYVTVTIRQNRRSRWCNWKMLLIIYIYIYIYISVWDLYSSFVLSVIPFMLSFFQYGPFSQW